MTSPPRRPTTFEMSVPILFEVPDAMCADIAKVFAGEYEFGFYGEQLTILDLGANVGSFSLWAYHRWPESRIIAFEPQPQTFEILRRNLGGFHNIECVNSAAYPTRRKTIDFFSQFPGDGEAGVAECMRSTFARTTAGEVVHVAATHPKDLPPADIVKLDVEGAEADILENMELDGVSLILLEYQNGKNRSRIKSLLAERFELVAEDEFAWDLILPGSGYRPDLAGDKWGHMAFVARSASKLTYVQPPPTSRRSLIHRALLRVARLFP